MQPTHFFKINKKILFTTFFFGIIMLKRECPRKMHTKTPYDKFVGFYPIDTPASQVFICIEKQQYDA